MKTYNYRRTITKEELIESLQKYRGIITKPMLDYLNSLINLEFSVIRDYNADSDREVLSELEIYKKVAIYNIYNRALEIFEQNESGLIISGYLDNEWLNVRVSLSEKDIWLFDFDNRETNLCIPRGYRTNELGTISLFKSVESKEQREKEFARVNDELELALSSKNPFNSKSKSRTQRASAASWASEQAEKIKTYEEKLKLLSSKRELTDEEKKEIEITKRFHELLLADYGLTNDSFIEEVGYCAFDGEGKTFVKRMPNITILNNIKHISN